MNKITTELRAAAEQIEQHGWTTAELYDGKSGCVCVLGAFASAQFGYDALVEAHSISNNIVRSISLEGIYKLLNDNEAVKYLAAFVDSKKSESSSPVTALWHWNDQGHGGSRTAEGVAVLLRDAAEQASNG